MKSIPRPINQLLLLALLGFLGSCVSIGEDTKKVDPADKLSTQRSIIVNYLNKGLPSRALKEVQRQIQLHPNDPDLLNLHGLAHLALNSPEAAAESLKKAYDIKPVATIALNLSSAYIENKNFNAATSVLLKLVKKKPTAFKAYTYQERIFHNLGLSAEKRGKIKLAEKYYRQGLKVNPQFYLTMLQLAGIKYRQGNQKLAFRYFRTANRVCKNCFEPVAGLMAILHQQQRHQTAARLLNKYLARRDVAQSNRERAKDLNKKLAIRQTKSKSF